MNSIREIKSPPCPRNNVNNTHMQVVIMRKGIRRFVWSDKAPSMGAVISTNTIDIEVAMPRWESDPPISFTTHRAKWIVTMLKEKSVFARSYNAHEKIEILPGERLGDLEIIVILSALGIGITNKSLCVCVADLTTVW